MCIDMNRQRLGDALIELTCNALVGRVYCIPLFAIEDAFAGLAHAQPQGGTAQDYLKANTPNAAFAYKWRLTPLPPRLALAWRCARKPIPRQRTSAC